MPVSNFLKPDDASGSVDLDEEFITDTYLVDKYVGTKTWTWGLNDYGQLGDGTTTNRSSPVQVGLLTNWTSITGGRHNILAIKTDGTLWGWGQNTLYATNLGDGTTASKSSPIQIGALATWKQVASGSANSNFIKTDGTMWSCGYNGSTYGVGDGNSISRSSPVQIGAAYGWKQAGMGYGFGIAVSLNGTLWGWGVNIDGGLGDGSTTTRYDPTPIGSLTNWKQAACGRYHAAAIKTNGTLWAWGNNQYGQLGDGTTARKSSPIQVGSLTNWKSVACGYRSMFAIKTDGTLWGCGYNYPGDLGDGTTTTRSSPVQIGLLTNWKQVASGGYSYYSHTIAVKTDGTLWTWGMNDVGQLGDGTTTNRSSPVQVGTSTNWKSVSAGASHSSATEFVDI